MDVLIIIGLIILAIILLLVEIFLLPGISIAGVLAGGCILYANYYAFANMGSVAGFITMAVSILACLGALILFMRSKTLDNLALKKDINSKIDRSAEAMIRIGDTGITTTRLAQIGYAEINERIVEVKSAGDFIDPKTPIRVVRITDGIILVEAMP